MDDDNDRIDEWNARKNESDGDMLKRVLAWIETYEERYELSEEEQEVASVLARRRLQDADDPLPKEVARKAVEETREEA